MKVILRGDLVDVDFIYKISEIIDDGVEEQGKHFFSIAKNPSFTVEVVNKGSIFIEESWLKVSSNGNKCDGTFFGKFLTESELPKWKAAVEKLKKTRDNLVEIWLNNQTEIPIIE